MQSPDTPHLTPNQIVAWNLRQARRLRGWTQDEATKQLEPYLGERWSKASYSAAERSVDSDRVRRFSADELYAFSRAFGLPIPLFLTPPDWAPSVGHAKSTETCTTEDYLDLIFDLNEDARKRMLLDIMPMTAETTLALHRWRDDFVAMVAERERAVEALLGVHEATEERRRRGDTRGRPIDEGSGWSDRGGDPQTRATPATEPKVE